LVLGIAVFTWQTTVETFYGMYLQGFLLKELCAIFMKTAILDLGLNLP
jgi:hypothetical protein